MLAMFEALVLGFVVLTVIYVLVSIYSRSVRRENLEKEFDSGDRTGDREAFIAQGMRAYAHSLRRKLIWLVYVIPTVAVVVIVFMVNRS